MSSDPSFSRSQLLSVIAHARAGALDRAWAMYTAMESPDLDRDPAALAVKARLLKDRALRAGGEDRQRLYAEAAQAYRRAAELGDATYPLINAATLSLLGGDEVASRALATEVLERIDHNPDEPETPYYRAATRAEALLLLGGEEEARSALAEAIALAPSAWEDHASTLRQFAIILASQSRDPAWLDAHRPPRSLHFGGHMAFRAQPGPTPLSHEVAAILEAERVGFGYGALAAGADIIVAEALIDRGAALHVILPAGVEEFASVSVDPHGTEWRRRFDSMLAAAETVRTVEPTQSPPDEAMIALADEIAMGTALINARLLASEGVQLLILADSEAEPESASARSREAWAQVGRQRIVSAPRDDIGVLLKTVPPTIHHRAAVLAIHPNSLQEEGLGGQLRMIKTGLDQFPMPEFPPSFTGQAVVLAYADIAQAAKVAAMLAEEGASVGGDYGIVDSVEDPFARALHPIGRSADLAHAAATSAPSGTACITGDFAAALAVAAPGQFRSEHVGELAASTGGEPISLLALKTAGTVL
ncbi:MAG: TRAFs-binding domain-containing protein [Sphingomonas sp.]